MALKKTVFATSMERICEKFVADLHKHIATLEQSQVDSLYRHINRYDAGNCAWYLYNLKGLLVTVLGDDAIRRLSESKPVSREDGSVDRG
jgi:hypothetical protein